MIRISRLLLCTLLILPTLTGCWDRMEMNDLGIAMGVAVDKMNNEYMVSHQVVLPKGKSVGPTGVPVTLYKSHAPTLFEAFQKTSESNSRQTYPSHLRVLVISEAIAREGITQVLDLFARHPRFRSDYYVVVARDTTAVQILSVLTAEDNLPAEKLFKSLDVSSKIWAPTTSVTQIELLEQLIGEGINPVLTGVKAVGNMRTGGNQENVESIDPEAILSYSGLAVFKKDVLVGWLEREQSKGYNYIRNNVERTAGHINCTNGQKISMETLLNKSYMKVRVEVGEPIVEVHMKVISQVAGAECKELDITDTKDLEKLQNDINNKLAKIMSSSVETVKRKYRSDIFGFGQAIYRAEPKIWDRLKDHWENHFVRLKVEYDVDSQIKFIGTSGESLKSKQKE